MSDEYVLDCHHHYGTAVMSAGARADAIEGAQHDPDEHRRRVGWMRDADIDVAIVMPVNRYLRPDGLKDTRRVNDEVAAYRDADPVNFPLALGITEPLHGEPGLEEIARLDDELAMIGVSYHTRWQGVATDDPWVLRGLAVLQERRMLPFVHAHSDSTMEAPFMVRHLAEEYPELPIIVTDAMTSPTQGQQFLSDAHRIPNLYFDTSCVFNILMLRHWVDELGAGRLVFGSNTYSANMVTMLTPAVIRSCGISADDTRAILSENMERLIEWTGRPYARP